MKLFHAVGVILFALSLRVQSAAVHVQDCGETFQSQLKQLLTTKESCDSAAFYDCCQVYKEYVFFISRGFHCNMCKQQ